MSQAQTQFQVTSSNVFMEQSILTLRKVYVPGGRQDDWGNLRARVIDLMVNLEVYGYTLSRDLAYALSHMGEQELEVFGKKLVTSLSSGVLGVRAYNPMYPNFPAQVLEASESELYFNAFMQGVGLWCGLRVLPKYKTLAREQSESILALTPKVLDIAVFDDYKTWVSRMIQANVAYSKSQKETLELFSGFVSSEITEIEFCMLLSELRIPNKENLSFWGKYLLDIDGYESDSAFNVVLAQKFAVTTDVLRLVAAIGGTDTSLAGKFVVPKLSRVKRKLILSLLDKVVEKSGDRAQVLENLLTYRSEWLRVAYACHSGEYAKNFPCAYEVLHTLRNEDDIETFNSKVEALIENLDAAGLASHLSRRPGVFARTLSRCLMVDAGEFVSYRKIAKAKSYIAFLEKKRSHAIAYNKRKLAKFQKDMGISRNEKKVNDIYRENDWEEALAEFKNRPMAQELSRIGLASLELLEKEAQGYAKSKIDAKYEELGKKLNQKNAGAAKKPEFMPKPESVEVPLVPTFEELMTKKSVKERKFFSEEGRAMLLRAFTAVVDKVSTPVLLQVHSHFKNIGVKMEKNSREIMPKGGLSGIFLQTGKSARFDEKACEKVVQVIEAALIARFSKLPALGAVYVDPYLQKQNVPFAQRSASKTLRTVARGSRFPVDTSTNILRMFLWWKDANNTETDSYGYGTDIDLGVRLLDKDYKALADCSYWNLKDMGMTHSGDIRSAPEGACEFIDVDLTKINKDAAYICININSYSGEPYCDLPECFGGWMARSGDAQEGKIFDARTVKDKVDLASASTSIIPMIFDVKNKEMIWVDTNFGNKALFSNAVNKSDSISMISKSWNEIIKPNLYDLFVLHAKARGTLVDKPEDAEAIYSLHEGVTPFDFEVIASEYMVDKIKE